MSEQSTGKLRAQELHRLFDCFEAYLNSDELVLLTRVDEPDSCGNPIHLDGPSFLSGFLQFLQGKVLEPERFIADLSYAMELSTYVRSGGIKAIAYRMQTGSSTLTPDIYDNLAHRLCYVLGNDGKFQSTKPETNTLLARRLKDIDAEDELRVSAIITEIDEALLNLSRKIEAVSLAVLESAEQSNQLNKASGAASMLDAKSGENADV